MIRSTSGTNSGQCSVWRRSRRNHSGRRTRSYSSASSSSDSAGPGVGNAAMRGPKTERKRSMRFNIQVCTSEYCVGSFGLTEVRTTEISDRLVPRFSSQISASPNSLSMAAFWVKRSQYRALSGSRDTASATVSVWWRTLIPTTILKPGRSGRNRYWEFFTGRRMLKVDFLIRRNSPNDCQ